MPKRPRVTARVYVAALDEKQLTARAQPQRGSLAIDERGTAMSPRIRHPNGPLRASHRLSPRFAAGPPGSAGPCLRACAASVDGVEKRRGNLAFQLTTSGRLASPFTRKRQARAEALYRVLPSVTTVIRPQRTRAAPPCRHQSAARRVRTRGCRNRGRAAAEATRAAQPAPAWGHRPSGIRARR
jgi:hypothetical protein